MKRVIIDMDHVMADITSQYISYYQQHKGITVNRESLLGKPETEAFPDSQLVRSFLYMPGFFRTPPVIKDSQAVIEALNQVYDVYIVSAALEFPQSLAEKVAWLNEHFPFITWQQIVFCGSKKIVHGDYMIDDHLKNLDYFEGEKLFFTATHNIHIDKHTRVNSWKEIADMLLPGGYASIGSKLQQSAAI
ncbi:5' nucleotidase, NT5C type [Deminuibacter soli]|uniref:5'(3')-deoxyribonucleotidase n=1 Tax=Deminuibacter soli TaxID=2291815 RepID=A0A3E1NDM1_9BACT|nr:5'(3')-deoxyribonucleotidase [Deminuibacter soli]RFM26073.1 5'(3')-deoxyribonucleotidase [Deminuibacter soli]